MLIQLVSYLLGCRAKTKIDMTAEIINESKADLILFAGNTLKTIDDAITLQRLIKNKKSTALIEVSSMSIGDLNSRIIHCLFLIQNGRLINLHTFQFFTNSDTIDNNDILAESFVTELEQRRKVEVCGKTVLCLQCGENNILKNIQSEDNRPVVRINDKQVNKRFMDVLHTTDIVFNDIHNPQHGNQNKLDKRRQFFSQEGRYYFSTNNCDELSSTAKSIQYAYYNGKQMDNIEPVFDCRGKYMYRLFEID